MTAAIPDADILDQLDWPTPCANPSCDHEATWAAISTCGHVATVACDGCRRLSLEWNTDLQWMCTVCSLSAPFRDLIIWRRL